MRLGLILLATLFALQSQPTALGSPAETFVPEEREDVIAWGSSWAVNCDDALHRVYQCRELAEQQDPARYLILLNSWEKLSWASVGFRRILLSSTGANLSLVEPCVWQGEVGGFLRPGTLELSAYWNVEHIRTQLSPATSLQTGKLRGSALVDVTEYVRDRRCQVSSSNSHQVDGKEASTTAERGHDPARVIHSLLLFVWWQDRASLSFDAGGLTDCEAFLKSKEKIISVDIDNGQQLFSLSDLDDGTGGRIELNHLFFRSLFCADPYSIAESGHSRSEWLAQAFDQMQKGVGVSGESYSVGVAGYRRMALMKSDEPEWGAWPVDARHPGLLTIQPALQRFISDFRDHYLPDRYLSVHFRAGRIFNKGTIVKGEFQRQRYDISKLPAVIDYPLTCARELIRRAHELMHEMDLQGIFLASDLDEKKMPELHRAETQPPLLLPGERSTVIENLREAAWILQSELSAIVFSTEDFEDQISDVVGMSAIIDAELLSGAAIFLHAGQYAGNCMPTGYSSSILERRRDLGLERHEYLGACCLPS